MADKLLPTAIGEPNSIFQRLKDMGNGTHARVVQHGPDASRAHLVSAASANPTVVKASPGTVLGWVLANTSAAWRYVKLHDQAAAPTPGAGVAQTIAIPPNGLAQFASPGGIPYAAGIGLTVVTGAADTDATAVGAGEVVGDLFFA